MSALADIVEIFKRAAAGEVMRLAAQQAEKELLDMREELARREQVEQERAEFVRSAIGSTSLEHLLRRHKDLLDILCETQRLLSEEVLPYLNRQAMLADDGDALELREQVAALLTKIQLETQGGEKHD